MSAMIGGGGEVACSRCTFLNSATAAKCEMCDGPLPPPKRSAGRGKRAQATTPARAAPVSRATTSRTPAATTSSSKASAAATSSASNSGISSVVKREVTGVLAAMHRHHDLNDGDLDDEIVQYLSSIAEDCIEDEGITSDDGGSAFASAVRSFYPFLEDDSLLDKRSVQLLGMLRKRKFLLSSKAKFKVKESTPATSAQAQNAAEPPVTDRVGRVGSGNMTGRAEDSAQEAPAEEGDRDAAAASEARVLKVQEDVSLLMELCQGESLRRLQRSHLEYVLVSNGGDVGEASAWVVEHLVDANTQLRTTNMDQLLARFEAWEQDREARARVDPTKNTAAVRDNVMGRFDEQVDDKNITRKPVIFWDDSHKVKGRKHIRYVDGNKVTMKSYKDKHVVEELKPEWDGGSRGKVKTKGKRGKGFV